MRASSRSLFFIAAALAPSTFAFGLRGVAGQRLRVARGQRLRVARGQRRSASTTLEAAEPLKDYKAEVNGLFFSVRLASLFPAGAVLGQIFGMPLVPGEPFRLGMAKRIYLLLGVGSLCSSLMAVTFSTAALNDLTFRSLQPAPSLADTLERDFDFLYTGTIANFVIGVVRVCRRARVLTSHTAACACGCAHAAALRRTFSLPQIGLTAMLCVRVFFWQECPVFGRTAAGMVIAAMLLMLDVLAGGGGTCMGGRQRNLGSLFGHYLSLLLRRATSGSMLVGVSLLIGMIATCYGVWGTHHVWEAKMRLFAAAAAAAAASK